MRGYDVLDTLGVLRELGLFAGFLVEPAEHTFRWRLLGLVGFHRVEQVLRYKVVCWECRKQALVD